MNENNYRADADSAAIAVGATANTSMDASYAQDDGGMPEIYEDIEEKRLRLVQELERLRNPEYLNTFSLNDLYDQAFPDRPPIIDSLLYVGTYILAGAPKFGKSFLVAQIAYHVSTGLPLWGYDVHQSSVLYLALEDDRQRLQGRMSRMFGVDGTDDLHFAIASEHIGDGLDIQLEKFLHEHAGTRLVIIDTLQKIRAAANDRYSYANDYEIIGRLKQFASRREICILLVHHTRKQRSEDRFDMISGTTGLLGCADGAFMLCKDRRTDMKATLDVVGRDQPDQRLHLVRDPEKLSWQLDHAEAELWKPAPEPLLDQIAGLVTESSPTWSGGAAELAVILGEEIKPNILTRRLNVMNSRLKSEYGIAYRNVHNRNGSCITLRRIDPQA